MSKTIHCHLDVVSALRSFNDDQLSTLFQHDNGAWYTADEARSRLIDVLSDGCRVLPFGEACDGFDYAGGGCPGHSNGESDTADDRGDRRGREWWDRYCALPKYSFLISSNGGVTRIEDRCGNYIDRHRASGVVDAMQSEINRLNAELSAMNNRIKIRDAN